MALPEQEIKAIKVKDLVLWSENPRDPIRANSSTQAIVDRALADEHYKWEVLKLANEMGKRYDYSELPTVVMHGDRPVVYDGNRRVIIGKIKLGYAKAGEAIKKKLPTFPEEIPCNVCRKDVALENVYRKHADSGSWLPLERDLFLHKFMGKPKSAFLALDDGTGIISRNPHLNQGFVKKEIFNEESLNKMGFFIRAGGLFSVHGAADARLVLSDIAAKVRDKLITTRKDRGNVLGVLGRAARGVIAANKEKPQKELSVKVSEKDVKRVTLRTRKKDPDIFGRKLYLARGKTGDLYRDIKDLYSFYIKKKDDLSETFPALIRMALRLLCETAAEDGFKGRIAQYISSYYAKAKQAMSDDVRTHLSGQGVKEDKLVELLHTGAHNYSAAANISQTLAIAIALGEMLAISHPRESKGSGLAATK